MPYSSNPFEPLFDFFRNHKQLGRIVLLILLLLGLLLCWSFGESKTKETRYPSNKVPISDADFELYFSTLQVTDLDQAVDASDARDLTLDNTSEVVEITEAGNYNLSGKLNGTIHINVKEGAVHIFLNGLEIVSKSGPAIYCESAGKLVITLPEGTENVISDSSDYRSFPNIEACIWSEADLTINGKGSLTVNGFFKDAIRSKDILKIMDGEYRIKSKRTALRGNDGLLIKSGKYTISTEKYGFMTTKNGTDGRGALVISGGEYNIIAGRYAFVTTKANLYIYNCTINNRSIIAPYDVGGTASVEWGVLDE